MSRALVAALEGLVVLDFTRLLPGPFCTQLLANLGADVIKIEDPALGDYMRSVPPLVDGTSYPFLMVNRGKRSLAVDLKTSEGQDILRQLSRRADVVVEQFRPGVMARLGASYDDLAMMNPRIVYCSFSGYGQTGPYKDLPGHDLNFEALAGILAVTRSGSDPRPAIPGVPIADLAGGFNAALAILAALRTRDRTGRGEFIDLSIYDTTIALMVLGLARYFATGEEPIAGETLLTGTFPFYALYETRDGRWLSVSAVEPKFWVRMCELVGAPELSERQFAEEPDRAAVAKTLAARFREKTLAEWERLFEPERLPIAPVKRLPEVVEDPHVAARNLLPAVDIPGLGKRRVIAHPAKHAVTTTANPVRVPKKGEHTEEILRSLGFSARQITGLSKKGIVAR
ncbi:MAG: CoA transferase [Methanobacteriota archaeon]|nr:MAG: CoA transferase [Euryarchaeota archaeon]